MKKLKPASILVSMAACLIAGSIIVWTQISAQQTGGQSDPTSFPVATYVVSRPTVDYSRFEEGPVSRDPGVPYDKRPTQVLVPTSTALPARTDKSLPAPRLASSGAEVRFSTRSKFGEIRLNDTPQQLWSPTDELLVQYLNVGTFSDSNGFASIEQALSIFEKSGTELLRLQPASHSPIWSPNGTSLLYRVFDRERKISYVYHVDITSSQAGAVYQDGEWQMPMGWIDNTTAYISTGSGVIQIFDFSNKDYSRRISFAGLGNIIRIARFESPESRVIVFGEEGAGLYRFSNSEFTQIDQFKAFIDSRLFVSPFGNAIAYVDGSCNCLTLRNIRDDRFDRYLISLPHLEGQHATSVAWLAKGQTILFSSRGIYSVNVDGSGYERRPELESGNDLFGISSNAKTGQVYFMHTKNTRKYSEITE